MPAPISQPKIGIMGAGPAGLTLARILLNNGISPIIYETDAHPDARPQGGSLDLHEETGQEALRRAGLFKEFQKFARYDDEWMTLTDQHNEVKYQIHEQDTGRPEIDRKHLRSILLDSLPADMIQWNMHLSKAEPGRLHFRDGTVEEGFDLIVGADGTWSHVRDILTPIKPFYSGIVGIEVSIHDVLERSDIDEETKAQLGRGAYWSFSDELGKAMMGLKMGDGSNNYYLMIRTPESWYRNSGVNFQNPVESRSWLKKEFSEFSASHMKWIDAIDGPVNPRPLYQLPVGLRWPHQRGVTLIGDAAHAMTPFAGEGVNTAMADALHLAEAILKDQSLDKAVLEYERWMFPFAAEVTGRTWESLMDRFDYGGLDKFVSMFQEHGEEPVKRTV